MKYNSRRIEMLEAFYNWSRVVEIHNFVMDNPEFDEVCFPKNKEELK